MAHCRERRAVDVGIDDDGAAQPPARAVQRFQQQAVVGAVEARRGEHAMRDAVRVEQRSGNPRRCNRASAPSAGPARVARRAA